MSLDRSLKVAGSLATHRNVLSRPERIAKLAAVGKFDMAAGNPLCLPKVGNRKVVTGGKSAKKDDAAATPGATPSAAAPAAAAKTAAAPKAAAAKPAAKPKGK